MEQKTYRLGITYNWPGLTKSFYLSGTLSLTDLESHAVSFSTIEEAEQALEHVKRVSGRNLSVVAA